MVDVAETGKPPPGALRRRLRPAAHWLAWLTGHSTRKARREAGGRILMLHAVGGGDHPIPAFEEQLLYLKRHFRVVPLPELIARGGAGAVALTFDDGLKCHLTHVYPVLRRLRMPATFFVCPGLVEEGRWIWTHEMRARLASLTPHARQRLFRGDRPLEWMKTLPPQERRIVEEKVRAATPQFRPTPDQRLACELMSWPELKALDPDLVTIGSHTLTHPILTRLDAPGLEREIGGSRRLLEERLGRPCTLFCYPNGSHDDAVVDCVRRHYEAAVTTESRFVGPSSDPCRLGRVLAGSEVARLAWSLHRPGGRPEAAF